MAKKKSKLVGSCGIYLCIVTDDGIVVLVHRRSKQVSEANMLASPGGIVERATCNVGADGSFDFDEGAKLTAVKELQEETGVDLNSLGVDLSTLDSLPVHQDAYWGPEWHRNFMVRLNYFPDVPGPEEDSLHEVIAGGTDDIGLPAGDNYHAWVPLEELLEREDLMGGCQVALGHVLALWKEHGSAALAPDLPLPPPSSVQAAATTGAGTFVSSTPTIRKVQATALTGKGEGGGPVGNSKGGNTGGWAAKGKGKSMAAALLKPTNIMSQTSSKSKNNGGWDAWDKWDDWGSGEPQAAATTASIGSTPLRQTPMQMIQPTMLTTTVQKGEGKGRMVNRPLISSTAIKATGLTQEAKKPSVTTTVVKPTFTARLGATPLQAKATRAATITTTTIVTRAAATGVGSTALKATGLRSTTATTPGENWGSQSWDNDGWRASAKRSWQDWGDNNEDEEEQQQQEEEDHQGSWKKSSSIRGASAVTPPTAGAGGLLRPTATGISAQKGRGKGKGKSQLKGKAKSSASNLLMPAVKRPRGSLLLAMQEAEEEENAKQQKQEQEQEQDKQEQEQQEPPPDVEMQHLEEQQQQQEQQQEEEQQQQEEEMPSADDQQASWTDEFLQQQKQEEQQQLQEQQEEAEQQQQQQQDLELGIAEEPWGLLAPEGAGPAETDAADAWDDAHEQQEADQQQLQTEEQAQGEFADW
mmetsp:Transcript_50660/g.107458  ORF Transcript_50660/g.107458 Transcript_50660/m.107458 type:complete len:697 (-) Transcript_50660:48-2138(-)